jgi:carbon monoxide dehydrogenase subunit G
MELSSTYTFNAPREHVWAMLIDPHIVAGCLPGCDSMEPVGEDTYRAVLTVGIAAVSGQYEGTVQIADQQPPERYRMVVNGKGRAGFVKGEATVSLDASTDDSTQTVVTVSGRGQVGGMIARVGQRLLGSVSKTMMDRFFDCLAQKVGAS